MNNHRQQIPVVVVPLDKNAKRLVEITTWGFLATERRAGRAAFTHNMFGRPFGDKLPAEEPLSRSSNDNPGAQAVESPFDQITRIVDQYVQPGKKTGN